MNCTHLIYCRTTMWPRYLPGFSKCWLYELEVCFAHIILFCFCWLWIQLWCDGSNVPTYCRAPYKKDQARDFIYYIDYIFYSHIGWFTISSSSILIQVFILCGFWNIFIFCSATLKVNCIWLNPSIHIAVWKSEWKNNRRYPEKNIYAIINKNNT